MALAVAAERPDLVDRAVLVNPATSFPRSPWPRLGPLLPRIPKVHRNFCMAPGCQRSVTKGWGAVAVQRLRSTWCAAPVNRQTIHKEVQHECCNVSS